jgi:hypothetical protein
MSRSGYSDDCDGYGLWRGTVLSAIRGKRGQAFLQALVDALDALPEKRLITHELAAEEGVCAIGSVGRLRGVDMDRLDPEDYDAVAKTFGIASPLAREIAYVNDEKTDYMTPEHRWQYVREWAERQLKPKQQEVK